MQETPDVTTGAPAPQDVSGLSIPALRKLMNGEPAAEAAEPVEEKEPSEAAPEAPAESIAADSDTAPKTEQEPAKSDDPDADLESKGGLKKRFSKLTRTIRDLEAKLAERPAAPEVKPDAMRTGPAAATPVESVDPNRPNTADYATYEEGMVAILRYELQKDRQIQAAAAEQEKSVTAWEARVEAAKAKYADFDEAVLNPEQEIKVSRAVEETLLASEHGPDLAYFLAKNPAEAARISALPPLAAAAAIGRMEATFLKAPEPPKAAVKPLPKPPAQVDGKSGGTAPDLTDPKIDFSDFKTQYFKQTSRR